MTPMAKEPRIRLLADDLTGALDSSAQFSARFGSLPVIFGGVGAMATDSLAFDCGTRDQTEQVAKERSEALGGFFGGAQIAMRKIDTLLRGHTFYEVAQSYRLGGFQSCIFAPAFPAQNRVTQGGRQWVTQETQRKDVAGPLAERLHAVGISPILAATPDQITGQGFFICDASTPADLQAIVTAGQALQGPILWCGAAGLAEALGGGALRCRIPAPPALMIIGSPHQNARKQLAAVRQKFPTSVKIATSPFPEGPLPCERGVSVLGFDLHGVPVANMASAITTTIDAYLQRLPAPPGHLIVTGGETLRTIADLVGATSLRVRGEIDSGIPLSELQGGHWHEISVISKSGAFGDPDTLVRLLSTLPTSIVA